MKTTAGLLLATVGLAGCAGLEVQDAMAFASAAAALKCTRSGGRAGIPSINDCLAFMRTHQ